MAARKCLMCLKLLDLTNRGSYKVCPSGCEAARCTEYLTGIDKVDQHLYLTADNRGVLCLTCSEDQTCSCCDLFHCPGCAKYQQSFNCFGDSREPAHKVIAVCHSCQEQVCKSLKCSFSCARCRRSMCKKCIQRKRVKFRACRTCALVHVNDEPIHGLDLPMYCASCFRVGMACPNCNHETTALEPERFFPEQGV